METIYQTYYVVKDLTENAYVNYFNWRGCNFTNIITKATLFNTIEKALEEAKYGELEYIQIDTIIILKDIEENNE